ncbi:SPOSA6832_04601 [Sporobolomyces salmonicolor]|uniref:SPOSA6832_04601-mRNA-1:cds n=1 Tax=Sporidiobolus salmonicolor TaxID=5005 RepID=A0A0D6ET54_SPOSA|nr:SPOSA6832_04601 [Sporobolomyces salmonicolor]
MQLPSPPTAAYLASSTAAPLPTPPDSTVASPFGSTPPSPRAQEHSLAYPLSPAEQPSTVSSSAAASRSASRSKDPLFKRRRTAAGGRGPAWPWGWVQGLFKGEKDEEIELRESRRRRLSIGQVEAALEAERRRTRETVAELARTPSRQSVPLSQVEGRKYWLTKEKAQLAVAFAMVGLVGMNDSATGANLDSMQAFYGVTYDKISIASPYVARRCSNTAGYFVSSVSASFLAHHLGLNYSLLIASAAMCTGCITLSVAPPFAAFIIALAVLGFGSGMYDACLTTVVSHEEDGVLMSCMYACFGVGAMFSPLIIGGFIDRGWSWNRYYYAPLSLSIFLAILGCLVFRTCTFGLLALSTMVLTLFSADEAPPDESHDVPVSVGGAEVEGEVIHGRARTSAQERMKRALKIRAVWAGFFLIMLAFGSSDTLSAWIVSFMVTKRNSPEAASRYQLAGLWGGIAFGRVVLAFVLGNRLGERSFSIIMLAAASAFLGVIWAVQNFVVDAVAMVLVGFFFGPVTPKVLSVVGSRVPPSLKSSVMSLTIGLGLIGSSVGPLLFGVVAGHGGLASLPAVLIGTSVITMGAWCLVPKNRRRED